jgi:flagellar FliJ protein
MPFRFSLQAVLDHRRSVEEQRQREFGEALTRLEAARGQRHRIEREIHRRHVQVREGQRGGLDYALRELIERWIDLQRQEAVEVDASIGRLDEEARRRRARLLEAVKARMVLERLRDRELRAFRQEEARAELKVFDEIAVRDYLNEHRREKDAHQAERIAR